MHSLPTSSLYTLLSEGDMSETRSTLTSRLESSLGVITKKFLNLLKEAPGMELDLNYAAALLEIHKRRLYDITNVLEGVGYISKRCKNSVRYAEKRRAASCSACQPTAARPAAPDSLSQLLLREQALEEQLATVNNELQALANQEENIKLAYVTYADLKQLDDLVCMSLFAVKTPPGTLLDFPHSENPKESVLTLTSHLGRIDVFYLQESLDAAP